jgi:hypothetical protein
MVYFDQGLITLFAASGRHACVCHESPVLSENSDNNDGHESNKFFFGTVRGYRRSSPKKGFHLSGQSAGVWKEFTMPQAKQTSKRKRRSKALPILGAAGLSLSLTSAASAVPSGLGDMPTSKTGTDNADVNENTHVSLAPFYAFDKESEGTGVTLGEEEISDVSLATFYVFDKEGDGTSSMVQLVGHGCGGCHGCGCGGCGGCGGCHHGCGCHGCVSIGVGCGGCGCGGWWGGCGGCGGHWCWWRHHRRWCRW